MKNLIEASTFLAVLFLSTEANALMFHSTNDILGPSSADDFFYSHSFSNNSSVDDIFLFTIASNTAPSILTTTASSTDIGKVYGINNFKYAITDDTGTILSDWGFSGQDIFYSSILANTTYGIYFKGEVSGKRGGRVAGINAIIENPSNVLATPIPAASWLFGGALLSVFGIIRKRRKTN